ncbi:MAG: serine/threonine-protein phosphatase, partial [Gammaproteobacteria bacterium]|nr:serine/threonine-protein phosphatase [Gammaproteobacteria bacterium]
MHYQSAQLSLIGDRETNQDRMVLLDHPQSVIGFVADGMGGHAGGEKAAAEAIRLVEDEFNEIQGKISNPKKFLRKTVAAAHDAIVNIGSEIEVDSR